MAREEPENRNPLTDRLKGEVGNLVGALGNRAVTSLLDKVKGTTGRLDKYVEGGAVPVPKTSSAQVGAVVGGSGDVLVGWHQVGFFPEDLSAAA